MLGYSTNMGTQDRTESDGIMSDEGPSKLRSESTNKNLEEGQQKVAPIISLEEPRDQAWVHEYMVHQDLYMTKVTEICEPKSYAEAAQDAEWKAPMEEEMHLLADNETWDLVDLPTGVKLKYNSESSINRDKAGQVANGYA